MGIRSARPSSGGGHDGVVSRRCSDAALASSTRVATPRHHLLPHLGDGRGRHRRRDRGRWAAGVHLADRAVRARSSSRRRWPTPSSVRQSRWRAARTCGCAWRWDASPAALTSLLYWAGTPMWLGGSLTVVGHGRVRAIVHHVGHRWFAGVRCAVRRVARPSGRSCRCATASGCRRWVRWVRSRCSSCFTGSTIAYGVAHGFHGIAAGDFAPSWTVFIAVVPILLYSFVGIELPSSAAEEMVDPERDIPVAIARAGVGQTADVRGTDPCRAGGAALRSAHVAGTG